MSQKPLPYPDGLEMAIVDGMEVNPYARVSDKYLASDTGSEKGPTDNVYEEDMRSRLHRDLKTRQIAMIALGGALGTGLLINT